MVKNKISYPYIAFPQRNPVTKKIVGEMYRPIVPIRISYGHKLSPSVNCLVDSGADRILLPAQLGEIVGINVKKGRKTIILGIGNVDITAYIHKIKIYLGNRSFITLVDFSYNNAYPLLGRLGFFNRFSSVNFKENKRELELLNKN